MDKIEAYTMLFTDSLVGNLVFNTSLEFVLHSMQKFGGYDSTLMVIVAVSGFFIASSLNYLLGIIVSNIFNGSGDQQLKVRSSSFKIICDKYLIYIMLLSGLPFVGKFLPLIAGISRQKFVANISIATISRLIYCTIIIFT